MVAQFAFADTAADMKTAQKLYKGGKFAQAEQNYQNVINKADPGSPEDLDRVFKARKKLPLVYLATGQQPKAKAAVQELLARHSGAERLPHAVHEIVEKAKEHNRTQQAGQIYYDIITAQPDHPQAVWLRMGIAVANVYLENDPAVVSGIEDIISQHSESKWAAVALAQTGWAYYKLEKYDKARPIYQYVVDNWPRKERAIRAHTALVRSCIYLKDYTAAEAQLQLLTERYGEDEKLPRVLNEIAKGYREQKLYDDAEPLSQYVLDNFPGRDECLWAQKSVVLARLGLGNKEGAKTATEAMLARFQTHKQANQAIADVAQAYRDRRMHAQARDLYKFNLDRYPDAKNAVWWVRGFVNQSAEIGDDASINAGIDKLFMQYSDKQGLPTVALHIGAQLCMKDHPRAAGLLQYVIDNHRDHKAALNAQVRMGHIHVGRGEDGRAESIYQDVMSYYANDPRLPQAIHLMAEGYWERAAKEPRRGRGMTDQAKGYVQKGLAKWEAVVSQFPNATQTIPEACYFAGESCSRLGQYETAIEYYQSTVDDWPDNNRAWAAQFKIARLYERLRDTEVISQSEADTLIAAAYQRVVQRYPDCPAAKAAQRRVSYYDNKSRRGGEK
jgi:TolA-binding protein